MGDINPVRGPNRDIPIEMVIMPQRTIRASTAQHPRKLVPPILVRTRDTRVIYGFGKANFQFYVKVTLCNPHDGSAIDNENPLVGGASQMITQRHMGSYVFDMRDPDGPYIYFVFKVLQFERLGEFKLSINMQVVDYRSCTGKPCEPFRYGGEASTRPFTVVDGAIAKEPNLLYEQNRMLWWLERHGCVEARSGWSGSTGG